MGYCCPDLQDTAVIVRVCRIVCVCVGGCSDCEGVQNAAVIVCV